MSDCLLSIAIPTYNREKALDELLGVIVPEVLELNGSVELLICDNASSDATERMVLGYRENFPELSYVRSSVNVGMDGNFQKCFELSRGKYLWMIGDDDLPKIGFIRKVMEVLQSDSPDLLHVRSDWHADLATVSDRSFSGDLSVIRMSRLDFVEAINIWFTFISGNIVKVNRLRSRGIQFKVFEGTKLLQLSWIAPTVAEGQFFMCTRESGILATAENSGGYKLFEVFGKNLHEILNREWCADPEIRDVLLRITAATYIPSLLWKTRSGRNKDFQREDVLDGLDCYKRFLSYWIFIFPIAMFPLAIAIPFAMLAKVWGDVGKLKRRIKSFVGLKPYQKKSIRFY